MRKSKEPTGLVRAALYIRVSGEEQKIQVALYGLYTEPLNSQWMKKLLLSVPVRLVKITNVYIKYILIVYRHSKMC